MASLVIWSGGRWRRVSPSGAVQGWRKRARFLRLCDGALRPVSGEKMLRLLRKGPRVPLAEIDNTRLDDGHRNKTANPSKKRSDSQVLCRDASVQTDTESVRSQPLVPKPTVRMCEQATNTTGDGRERDRNKDVTDRNKATEAKENVSVQPVKTTPHTSQTVKKQAEGTSNLKKLVENNVKKQVEAQRSVKKLAESNSIVQRQAGKIISLSDTESPQPAKNLSDANIQKALSKDTESDSSSSDPTDGSHQLVITKEYLMLIRRFAAKRVSGIDLERFDSSKEYQKMVLYRLNPLVVVSRAPLAELLRLAQARSFARSLGLKPRTKDASLKLAGENRSSSERNERSERSRRRTRERNKKASSDERSDSETCRASQTSVKTTSQTSTKSNTKTRVLPTLPKPKRSSVANGREYTALEDQAIVAWLGGSSQRERGVNGNMVWRELENAYKQITGVDRTWQSLRNRYLRYLLPSLGSLALEPEHAQRLRARAAQGEIKTKRKMAQRRNSLFAAPTTGALSRRLKPVARLGDDSDDSFAEPKTKVNRSLPTPKRPPPVSVPAPVPKVAPKAAPKLGTARTVAKVHEVLNSEAESRRSILASPTKSILGSPSATTLRSQSRSRRDQESSPVRRTRRSYLVSSTSQSDDDGRSLDNERGKSFARKNDRGRSLYDNGRSPGRRDDDRKRSLRATRKDNDKGRSPVRKTRQSTQVSLSDQESSDESNRRTSLRDRQRRSSLRSWNNDSSSRNRKENKRSLSRNRKENGRSLSRYGKENGRSLSRNRKENGRSVSRNKKENGRSLSGNRKENGRFLSRNRKDKGRSPSSDRKNKVRSSLRNRKDQRRGSSENNESTSSSSDEETSNGRNDKGRSPLRKRKNRGRSPSSDSNDEARSPMRNREEKGRSSRKGRSLTRRKDKRSPSNNRNDDARSPFRRRKDQRRSRSSDRNCDEKSPFGRSAKRRSSVSSPLSYRSLTRRFALRHRSTPSDPTSPHGGKSSPTPAAPRRTRRLYNP